jgi:hypothetical protein
MFTIIAHHANEAPSYRAQKPERAKTDKFFLTHESKLSVITRSTYIFTFHIYFIEVDIIHCLNEYM